MAIKITNIESKPILIIGPPGSGKTHIAMAIMDLLPGASVKTNSDDPVAISRWAVHPDIKLIVVEQVTNARYLLSLWSDLQKFASDTAFVFTSQFELEAHPDFTIINCNNKH